MMDYELKMQEIRRLNEEKLLKDKEKALKIEKELIKQRKVAEIEKFQSQIDKKAKMEEDLALMKRKQQEIYEKVNFPLFFYKYE